MNVLRKVLGPKSKYDKTLPYTYAAKFDTLRGQGSEPVYDYFYSSTICGLIEYLVKNAIEANEVDLLGVYRKKEMPLDIKFCTSSDGKWLNRPDICKSLESHYLETLDGLYKGHTDAGDCSYVDRERDGSGPALSS